MYGQAWLATPAGLDIWLVSLFYLFFVSLFFPGQIRWFVKSKNEHAFTYEVFRPFESNPWHTVSLGAVPKQAHTWARWSQSRSEPTIVRFNCSEKAVSSAIIQCILGCGQRFSLSFEVQTESKYIAVVLQKCDEHLNSLTGEELCMWYNLLTFYLHMHLAKITVFLTN